MLLVVLQGTGLGVGLALIAAGLWGLARQRDQPEPERAPEPATPGDERDAGERRSAGSAGTDAPARRRRPEADVEAQREASDVTSETGGSDVPASRSRVYVRLLGPVRVEVDGAEVVVPGRRLELLSYLVLHPYGVSSARAADALWPNVQPGREADCLANTLRRLRKDLRQATGDRDLTVIDYVGEKYRIDREVIDTDVWQFRAALRAASEAADSDVQARWLARATSLYQGSLVAGAYSWAAPFEQELREEFMSALSRLAELREQGGDLNGAVVALRRALGEDPTAEVCAQRLMQLQARTGQVDGVRRTFRRLQASLAELGETPNPATRRLRDELIAAGATEMGEVHR